MREKDNIRRRLGSRLDIRQEHHCRRHIFKNGNTDWWEELDCLEHYPELEWLSKPLQTFSFKKISPPAAKDIASELEILWSLQTLPLQHEVKLHFVNQAAKTVAKVHFHSSQQARFMDDGSLVVVFRVSHPDAMLHWLLRYGNDVKVLSPKWLGRKVCLASKLVRSTDRESTL